MTAPHLVRPYPVSVHFGFSVRGWHKRPIVHLRFATYLAGPAGRCLRVAFEQVEPWGSSNDVECFCEFVGVGDVEETDALVVAGAEKSHAGVLVHGVAGTAESDGGMCVVA